MKESDNFFIEFISLPMHDDELFVHYVWKEDNCLDKFLCHLKCGTYGDCLKRIRIEFYVEGEKDPVPIGVESLKGLSARYISFKKESGVATIAFWVPRRVIESNIRRFLADKYTEATKLAINKRGASMKAIHAAKLLSDVADSLHNYLDAHRTEIESRNGIVECDNQQP